MTRLACNGGIVCLLAAVTVSLAPPRNRSYVSPWGLAMLLAFLGFLGEVAWMATPGIQNAEIFHRWLSRRPRG